MNLQFAVADQEDINVIFAQAKKLIDTYEDISSIDYDRVINWVKNKIARHLSSYQCVLCDGQKVAYYRLCADGELDDLHVLPQFQNHGIGSEILKKCIEQSSKPLYLYVFSQNIRAISLYERFGFNVTETVGNTRLIMRRRG